MNAGIYNNLLTTFDTRYMTKHAHNSSELRSVVRRIRKQTQSSPVYLLNFTNAKQSYVLGVKDASMRINDSLQTLADDSQNSIFSRKKAQSSDVEQIGAELVEPDLEQLPNAFSIRVKQLANAQVNQGKEYYETGKGLSAGSYQFRVTVNDVAYDFQYNIRKDANHREVIGGLSDFITKAKIGIQAEPYAVGGDKIGMRLESTMVGAPEGRMIFTLQDRSLNSSGKGIVSYYGLDHVVVQPKSAVFDLNGVEKTSLSNEFTLGRAVKVSLRKPSDAEAVIDYHPDSEAILSGVKDFIENYNTLIRYNHQFEEKTGTPSKLLRELKSLAKSFSSELESCGIRFDEEGYMELDTSLAVQAIEDGDMKKLFQADSVMSAKLFMKTDSIKINPMEYVDKKIVSYPNFEKPPKGYSYITSLYSGLLFNYYC